MTIHSTPKSDYLDPADCWPYRQGYLAFRKYLQEKSMMGLTWKTQVPWGFTYVGWLCDASDVVACECSYRKPQSGIVIQFGTHTKTWVELILPEISQIAEDSGCNIIINGLWRWVYVLARPVGNKKWELHPDTIWKPADDQEIITFLEFHHAGWGAGRASMRPELERT